MLIFGGVDQLYQTDQFDNAVVCSASLSRVIMMIIIMMTYNYQHGVFALDSLLGGGFNPFEEY